MALAVADLPVRLSVSRSAPEEYAQAQGPFEVKVFRNQKAFAPADVVDVRVIVNSQAPKRVKLKSITVMIRQITVFKTPQRAPDRRLEILATKTKSLRKKLATNEFFLQDMALTLPKKSTVMSVHTAKHIQITHEYVPCPSPTASASSRTSSRRKSRSPAST